jgi:hypothetical protein
MSVPVATANTPTVTVATNTLTFTWSGTNTPTSYEVILYQVLTSGGSASAVLTLSPTTATSGTYASLITGNDYYTTVVATNGNGPSALVTSSRFSFAPPVASASVALTGIPGTYSAVFTWSGTNGATSYNIALWSSGPGGIVSIPFLFSNPTTLTTYTYPNIVTGNLYYMTVSAFNTTGTSLTTSSSPSLAYYNPYGGPQGIQGYPGIVGQQGPAGPQGQQGPQGIQGVVSVTNYTTSNVLITSGTSRGTVNANPTVTYDGSTLNINGNVTTTFANSNQIGGVTLSNGYAGINCNAPTYTLDVNGNGRVSAGNATTNTPSLLLTGGGNVTGQGGVLALGNPVYGTCNDIAQIAARLSGSSGNIAQGWLSIYTRSGTNSAPGNAYVERMTISNITGTTATAVGIAQTTPAYTLDVGGQINAFSAGPTQTMNVRLTATGTSANPVLARTLVGSVQMGNGYGPWLNAYQANSRYTDGIDISICTNNNANDATQVERLTVQAGATSGGLTRVGIACNSPAYTLDVNGNVKITTNGSTSTTAYGTTNDTLTLLSTCNAYAGGITSIFFGNQQYNYPLARIYAQDAQPSSGAAYLGRLVFQTNNQGTTLVERMRIDSNGYIGIGQSAPQYILDVTTAGNTQIRIGPRQFQGTAADTSTYGLERSRHEIRFAGYRDAMIDKIGSKIVSINKQTYGGNVQPAIQSADLVFFTSPPGTGGADDTVERMRIMDTGNVGIGTAAPGYALDVTGVIRASSSIYADGNVLLGQVGYGGFAGFQHSSLAAGAGNYALLQDNSANTYLNAGSGRAIYLRTANNTIGTITSTGLRLGDGNTASFPLDVSGQQRIYEGTGTGPMNLAANGLAAKAGMPSGSLILQHGDSGGQSSIVFRSTVNQSSDYGYITYVDDVCNQAGQERSRLLIGTENDLGVNSVQDATVIQPFGGCVGIGQLNPAHALDVTGNINATQYVFIRSSYSFVAYGSGSAAGSNTYMYNDGGGNGFVKTTGTYLNLGGGNANSVIVTNNAMSINTFAAPNYTLDVTGSARIAGLLISSGQAATLNGGSLNGISFGKSYVDWMSGGNGVVSYGIGRGVNNFPWYTGAEQAPVAINGYYGVGIWDAGSWNSGTPTLTVAGGRVGVQCNAPAQSLDVNGNAQINAYSLIGKLGPYSNYAGFQDSRMDTSGPHYTLLTGDSGTTYLNASPGKAIYFRNTNVTTAWINSTSLIFAIPQGSNGVSVLSYSNVPSQTNGTAGTALTNTFDIPYTIDIGTDAASAYAAAPTNGSAANATTNPNYLTTAGAMYNRVRAVGGFVSYTVTQWYAGQNINIHWYIPWGQYQIMINNYGMSGGGGEANIANYGSGLWAVQRVTGTGYSPVIAGLATSVGAPSFGFYSYGCWQIGNGSSTSQVTTTSITILGLTIAHYNGRAYGVH